MRKLSCRAHQPKQTTPQMVIAFQTKGEFEHEERAEVVALLSQLLLQVASANSDREVDDDAP